MKRSFIDSAIDWAIRLLDENNMRLPALAYLSADEFAAQDAALDNANKLMLGWDVTDFGSGDFDKIGAVLFTIRNGLLDASAGTPYAEKLIFMKGETEQEIPYHFHAMKTEDIINRAGGTLCLQLFGSLPGGALDETGDVHVYMDGILKTFPAGSVVEVKKGDSITLTPGLYHRFYAKREDGDLIVGEVSSINDDRTDNHFLKPGERFNKIEEDAPARHRLCND